jgi:Vps52, C-terminal
MSGYGRLHVCVCVCVCVCACVCVQSGIATDDDLLGAEEGSLTSFFSFRPKDRAPVFAIGQRANVLKNMNAPLVVPSHMGEKKLCYEQIYRYVFVSIVTSLS